MPADHRLPIKFTDTTAVQAIGRMYSYRSALAHGGLGSDHLAWLEKRCPLEYRDDPHWLTHILRRLTQRVLQAALAEPQLITDPKGA